MKTHLEREMSIAHNELYRMDVATSIGQLAAILHEIEHVYFTERNAASLEAKLSPLKTEMHDAIHRFVDLSRD